MHTDRYVEPPLHGLLLGALVGIVVGAAEFIRFMVADALSEATGAYWSIAVPHVIVGAGFGLLVGLVAAVLGRRHDGRTVAILGVWPAVAGLSLSAYLVAWATQWLARPIFKLSNILAYIAAVLLGAALALALRRVLRAVVGRLERRGDLVLGRARVAIPIALALVIGLGLGVPAALASRPPATPGPAAAARPADTTRPNVLMIIVDTLRPDHLSLYGYSRETDPRIKAFAQKGMVFNRMHAQAPMTRPSVATLLSSLYPGVHRSNDVGDFLSQSITTLPEVLQEAGYTTFGISANANVSPTFGYTQGFDEFIVWKQEDPVRLTLLGRTAEFVLGPTRLARILSERPTLIPEAQSITDTTLAWAKTQPKQPYFMYVHYIDPHYPYRPPAPYDRAFDHQKDAPKRRNGTVNPQTLVARDAQRDTVAKTLDQYDGEILYTDHHVGRLLDGLRDLGRLDNTIVIITADHGEEFFEHGQIGHGKSAYEEVLWIPFVMVWPGKIPAGSKTDQMVGLIDVMPTLLAAAGLDAPKLVQGTSFASLFAKPDAALPPRTLFAQVLQVGFSIDMARNDSYKFVQHPYGPKQGREEYYDLYQDPLERADLGTRPPLPAVALKKELKLFQDIIARASSLTQPEQVKKLDRDTERALRSLGYIK
jgi:arylsulfatase A-like enzyme